MRRILLIFLVLAAALCACGRQEWQNLRQLCESFNRFAAETDHLANIEPGQFTALRRDDSTAYQAYLGDSLLLACDTLRNGRVHTVSLTGLPEQSRREFFDAARCLAQAYTGAAADQAERWLHRVRAGESEVLGVIGHEENGFRFSQRPASSAP